MPIIPPKMKPGDGVRVIAPSCSLASISWMTDEFWMKCKKRFEDWGLHVTEGKHIREVNDLNSSSIESRIEDLHDAFHDPDVKMICTVRGGFLSNQLLRYIDYDLVKKNPKILVGFSDITALSNALYAKTGLVGYSGPNFYYFGFRGEQEYDMAAFKKCLFDEGPFEVKASPEWTAERWSIEKSPPLFEKNDGYWVLHEGAAEGTLIGGNLCTFKLLHGTEFMPSLKDTVLFIEDDHEWRGETFDRNLQALIHQPGFEGVRGIVFGRFEKPSNISRNLLTEIVETKKELKKLPIIANADFGHTQPLITFPIGGTVKIAAKRNDATMEILTH